MKWLIVFAWLFVATFAHAEAMVAFTTDLFEGMPRSNEVYRLSIVLKKEGFYTGELTSRFTSEMTDAVSRFQNKKHIAPVNGIVGKSTRYELNKIILKWIDDTKKPKSTSNPLSALTQPNSLTITTKKPVPLQQPDPIKVTVKTPQKPAAPVVKQVVTTTVSHEPCEYKDKTYKDGARVRMYLQKVAPIGGRCQGRWRVCENGQFDGDLSYRHLECVVPVVKSNGDVVEEKDNTATTKKITDDTEDSSQKTNTKTKTTTKTTTTTTTTKKGCVSGSIHYDVGGSVQGCIGPGRSDPTPDQCLAALMPTYRCETYGWNCVDKCKFNYY